MFGCLLVIFGILLPRITLLYLWIINFFDASRPWNTYLWPVLGWIFMPYTTLVYGCCYVYNNGEFDVGWIILTVLAVLFDLGSDGSTRRK